MDLAKSQERLLFQLKQRGAQSVKTLSNQLAMTTMGVRQHLAALQERGLIEQTEEQKQQRGRPLRQWKLTEAGHQQFPDAHAQISLDLIASVRDTFGEDGLNKLIDKRTEESAQHYRQAMQKYSDNLPKQLEALSQVRSQEGYMAEIEELAGGEWLLIENHCPICAAAQACQGFCRSELEVFQQLLEDVATVSREDHILKGARRCAYRIQKL